ncbi:hypothetical protein BH09ACT6_BH09ACT6_24590 [soil metagenome]
MRPLYTQDPAATVQPAERALRQRLRAAAAFLLPPSADVDGLSGRGTGVLADALARRVQHSGDTGELWLLLTTLAASFPDAELVNRARRELALNPAALPLTTLLDCISRSGVRLRSLAAEVEIVEDVAVVDVDFCARHDHNTGIQRVVRQTVALWAADHPLALARWTDSDEVFCRLAHDERRRVLEWNVYSARTAQNAATGVGAAPLADDLPARLIVPYRTTVVLPEVARESVSPRLAALAEFSGNRVVMIGYDTIPFVSGDLVLRAEIEKFARYSTVVKNATRVAAISSSAAEEFAGYVSAVRAQGLDGPQVSTVVLPAQVPGATALLHAASLPAASAGRPEPHRASSRSATPEEKLVLVVGNQEPRKNLLAVLAAAESLWRTGLVFRLRMIGGARPDYKPVIDREVARLCTAGFSVELLRGVDDDVLTDSYRRAWFTVFPSIHEGYGLPVAESLASGVPSITSNYGSTAEIAAGGGCLTVDPRDDADLAAAMRVLLTDGQARERLVVEARNRRPRSWSDYAGDLWRDLMEPMEAEIHD